MKSRRALEPIFYCYEHHRPDTGACFYVGKGYGNRAGAVSRRSLHHKNIQAKLERLGMKVDVRIIASGLTEADAIAVEIERIRYWRSLGVKLVNLTDGGEGMAGFVVSDEARAKMRLSARKRPPRTEEQNRRHSEKMTGFVWPQEVVEKRAASSRGKKRSPEQRARMSAGRIGMKFSDEHRRNLSIAHKGKKSAPKTPEGIEKLRACGRKTAAIRKAKRLEEIEESRQYVSNRGLAPLYEV